MMQSENDNSKILFNILKDIEQPVKNAVNPFFKSKYSTLEEVKRVVDNVCFKHNCYIQTSIKKFSLTTELINAENGNCLNWVEMNLPELNDPQKMGSAITYYRRYSLVTMFNLVADDDDGNSAKPKEKTKQNNSKKYDDDDIMRLKGKSNKLQLTDEEKAIISDKFGNNLEKHELIMNILIKHPEKRKTLQELVNTIN